jgi:hypothetical protein
LYPETNRNYLKEHEECNDNVDGNERINISILSSPVLNARIDNEDDEIHKPKGNPIVHPDLDHFGLSGASRQSKNIISICAHGHIPAWLQSDDASSGTQETNSKQ